MSPDGKGVLGDRGAVVGETPAGEGCVFLLRPREVCPWVKIPMGDLSTVLSRLALKERTLCDTVTVSLVWLLPAGLRGFKSQSLQNISAV